MLDSYIFRKLKKIKFISGFLQEESFAQLKKYLVTGVLAFVSECTAFNLLLPFMSKYIANFIGMFIGFWISFLLNRYWSFESKNNLLKQLLRYSLLFAINFLISSLLLNVSCDIIGIPPSISKLVIMCMVVVWNFFIFQKIIFRNSHMK